jgi:hypothetical protein
MIPCLRGDLPVAIVVQITGDRVGLDVSSFP